MSLAKNASKMGLAVFISRILGLVREQVFAYLFGAANAADAYFVAFRIPNLLRDLFAEGALSAAFITVFARCETPQRGRDVARDVMIALTLILGIVCSLMIVFAPGIVGVMAGKFSLVPGKFELTVGLSRLMMPFLYFAALAALAMGILNSLGSFFMPSMGAAAFNVGSTLVGGGLSYFLMSRGPESAIWGFSFGVLVGGFLQWGTQWPGLLKRGFVPWAGISGVLSPTRIRKAFKDPAVREIARLMGPATLGLAAVQINILVNTSFAAGLEPGSVSWLLYAYRIMHFPMGVFGVALSTVTHAGLARMWRENDRAQFSSVLELSIKYSMILALGSAAGLIVFREPLVSMIYQHGHFTPRDTVMAGQALAAYALGLVAFNSLKIYTSAFYALADVWLPSFVSVLAILLNYTGNWYLSKRFGHAGLAATTSIVALTNSSILLLGLRRKGVRFGAGVARVFAACAMGVAAIAAAAAAGIPQRLLLLRAQSGTLIFTFSTLICVALFGALYLGIVGLLTHEGRELAQRLRSRFLGRRA